MLWAWGAPSPERRGAPRPWGAWLAPEATATARTPRAILPGRSAKITHLGGAGSSYPGDTEPMTINENLTPAEAAKLMAEAAILTAARAQALLDNEPAFLARADRMAVALDATGRYEDVAYADLCDAAYEALAARCESLT